MQTFKIPLEERMERDSTEMHKYQAVFVALS